MLVGFLWLIGLLNYMDRMAVFAVFPLLRQEMPITDMQIALVGSVFLWVYSASSPLGGYVGDRFRRRKVILWSLVLFSLVTFGTGLIRSGNQLIILRSLLGISEALFIPTALAYIAEFHTDRTRSLAIGLTLSGLDVGGAFGGAYAGYMGEHFSWRLGFYVLGIGGVLLALALWPLLREKNQVPETQGTRSPPLDPPQEKLGQRLRAILTTPTVLAIVFIGFALSLTSWPVANWMPLHIYEKFGLSLAKSGFIANFYENIFTMVGVLAGGVIADRWARRDQRGRMGLQAIGIGLTGFGMLGMGVAASVGFLSFSLMGHGIGRGLVECNFMPLFCYVVAPSSWATTYGLLNLMNTLGGSLGVIMVGAMKPSWGIANSLAATAVVVALAFLLSLVATFHFLPRDMQKAHGRSEQAAEKQSTVV